MKQKVAGFGLFFIVCTLVGLLISKANIPLLTAYIFEMLAFNFMYAIASIFSQRAVILLYEANIYEECNNIWDFAFKYFYMYSSGINYYVQTIIARVPFIVNKVIAILFTAVLGLLFLFCGLIFNEN